MYNFNTARKRLEPTDTKCQYCELEHSSHMEDNYFVPLFKEQDRTNIVVYRSVKYSKVPVGIPRCKNCQAIHDEARTKSAFWGWGAGAVIVILSFMIWGPLGFISIFLGLLMGFLGTHLIENRLVRNKGIFTKLDGAKRNDAVQELVIGGWSFSQPTA